MLEVTISDFHQLVLSDIKSTFEKIDSSNIMNEIDESNKKCNHQEVSKNTLDILNKIMSFREELKNDLEKIEKIYNINWEKDQNEWTLLREKMYDKMIREEMYYKMI